MKEFKICTIVLIFILNSAGSSIGQETKLLGFTRSSAGKQLNLEMKIIGKPSADRMDIHHKIMTAKPHHAGTAANFETAEYYAAQLREFGFDKIIMNRYSVLLPRPIDRTVELGRI